MQIQTIIHDAEEGGYWAEAPALPGCVCRSALKHSLLEDLMKVAQIKESDLE